MCGQRNSKITSAWLQPSRAVSLCICDGAPPASRCSVHLIAPWFSPIKCRLTVSAPYSFSKPTLCVLLPIPLAPAIYESPAFRRRSYALLHIVLWAGRSQIAIPSFTRAGAPLKDSVTYPPAHGGPSQPGNRTVTGTFLHLLEPRFRCSQSRTKTHAHQVTLTTVSETVPWLSSCRISISLVCPYQLCQPIGNDEQTSHTGILTPNTLLGKKRYTREYVRHPRAAKSSGTEQLRSLLNQILREQTVST